MWAKSSRAGGLGARAEKRGQSEASECPQGGSPSAKAAAEHREHYENIPERTISACGMFSDPTDISSTREAFQALSKPVSMWVGMAKPEGEHVMYCSMKKAGLGATGIRGGQSLLRGGDAEVWNRGRW